MNRRRVSAVVVGLSGAAIVAASTPAWAGLPVLAQANVDITYTSTAFTVCADGQVDDGTGQDGAWLFEMDGARSDGSQIHQTLIWSGETFTSRCYSVPKNGTANGAFGATLSFATVGSGGPNAVPDYTAVAGAEGSWNPNNSNSFRT